VVGRERGLGEERHAQRSSSSNAQDAGRWLVVGRAEEGWAPAITYGQRVAVDAFDDCHCQVFREREKVQSTHVIAAQSNFPVEIPTGDFLFFWVHTAGSFEGNVVPYL